MAEAGNGSPTFLCLYYSLRPASAGRFLRALPTKPSYFTTFRVLTPRYRRAYYLSDFGAKTNIDRPHNLAPLPNISIFTQISPVGSRKM
jgi:hypothetical protein